MFSFSLSLCVCVFPSFSLSLLSLSLFLPLSPKGTSSSGKAADAIGFEEDGGGSPVRKRRKTTRNFDTSSSVAMVLPHYQSADVTSVEVEDSLFGGLELLVLSGDGTLNKQQVGMRCMFVLRASGRCDLCV